MNLIRSKYFYQIGHYCAGLPENLAKVDEGFLRQLEEQAGIQEREVECWRRMIYNQYLDGECAVVDAKMGHILCDRGSV